MVDDLISSIRDTSSSIFIHSWMTVHQLVCYHSLITLFKIRSSGEPEYLSDVVRRDNVYGRIIIPNTGLGLAKKSFTLRASLQWNLLPASLRTTARIGLFKVALKKWIKCNIQRFIDWIRTLEMLVGPRLPISVPFLLTSSSQLAITKLEHIY